MSAQGPEQISYPPAHELSVKFESFLKGCVRGSAERPVWNEDLVVLHDEAFVSEDDPAAFRFKVLDLSNQLLYGVVANFADGQLSDYRAGIISL